MADSPETRPDARDRVTLAIDVLGPVTATAVHPDGRRVKVDLTNRKSRALLGFIAIHDQKYVSRERLAGLLWCDVEQRKAHGSLRNALYEMRDALTKAGFKGLTGEEQDKLGVPINRDNLTVDLGDIYDALGRGEIHPLLLSRDRIFESLFEDVRLADEEFHTYTRTKQASFKRRAIERLEDIMRAETTNSELREVSARALSRLDPSHEEAARARMRAHAEVGDTGAALTIYKELFDHLAAEHDAEPSAQTVELNAAIALEKIATKALPAELTSKLQAGMRLVIGVCPFNLAGVPKASHYLVQGFRTELINSLVHFRDWMIHEPPHAYLPGVSPPGQSGEYYIEASGTEAGNEVRLVVMVRDALSGQVVCSERLHISIANWFDSQDLVVRRLSRQLNLNISEERLRMAERKDIGQQPIAFDIWLKHDADKHMFTPEQWFAAEREFKRLTKVHPDLSRGHSSLASMENMRHYIFPGVFRDMARTERGVASARVATRLDPSDAHCHNALAYSYALSHQFELAEAHFRLMLEYNENSAWGSVSAAAGLGLCGHIEEAIERAERAISLLRAPNQSMWAYLGCSLLYGGRYRGAVNSLSQAGSIIFARAALAAALAHDGQIARASAEYANVEAKLLARWKGKNSPSRDLVAQWLLHLAPIQMSEHWNQERNGLELAGADTHSCQFQKWPGQPPH